MKWLLELGWTYYITYEDRILIIFFFFAISPDYRPCSQNHINSTITAFQIKPLLQTGFIYDNNTAKIISGLPYIEALFVRQ